MEFLTSDQVAIAAAAIAALSLLVSAGSMLIAKRAFKLSRKEHDERYLSVKPYLVHAYKQKIGSERYCFFALSYTNRASVADSISAIELELEYADEDGMISKVKLRPTLTKLPVFEGNGYQRMNIPVRLEAKESVSGWTAFELPVGNGRVRDIQCYRVHARLANDQLASVRTYLLNEVQSEQTRADQTPEDDISRQ